MRECSPPTTCHLSKSHFFTKVSDRPTNRQITRLLELLWAAKFFFFFLILNKVKNIFYWKSCAAYMFSSISDKHGLNHTFGLEAFSSLDVSTKSFFWALSICSIREVHRSLLCRIFFFTTSPTWCRLACLHEFLLAPGAP